MRLGLRGLWLSLLCVLFILPVASAETEEQAGNPFGVVEGFWLPDVVCELNPGWERIIFDWAQHQPSGPDDWHTLNVDDRWLAAARDCNREVVAVIKHTPDWATDGLPGAGVPRGLYLPVDDPQNLWANFMRRAADYYAPRGVKRFIIWNEPDISRETYGYEFEGSLDDYFQLLKVAYLAVRSANPEAEILLAGTTYWHDVNEGRRLYLDRLFERIMQDSAAAANSYYFDVVSLHIYFRTETVYDIVHEVRALLDQYGLNDKRIWINEMNAAPTDDPLWPVVRPVYHLDLEQQVGFLVQGAALGLAAGAERLSVFKFYDWSLPPGGEAFGLLRADGSRRPAFDAWKMVIRQFNGITQARLARTDRVDAVLLTRSDGQQMLVTWARADQNARLRVAATGSEALLLDPYGHPAAISPGSDGYILELAAARCNSVDGCAVGGTPLILLQPQGVESVQDVTQGSALELSFE